MAGGTGGTGGTGGGTDGRDEGSGGGLSIGGSCVEASRRLARVGAARVHRLPYRMPQSSSDEFLRPYRNAVAQHGPGFEATLWSSRESQALRFDVMIDLASLAGCAVMDLGCGHGDFAARLLERGVPFRRYVGVDAIAEVIEAARGRRLERSDFVVADILETADALAETFGAGGPPDFVCLSGTLNTMDDPHARRLVKAAFDAAAQGVVFNFLSNRPHARFAGSDTTPARRFDTAAWLDWAMGLSSRVSFTQDYLDGHDATIMVRHEA